MTRLINPRPQYRPSSRIFFFKSGTNTQLVTYKDELESPGLENTHPVICDALGNLPNVFFSGTAKMVALDENDVQYFERDPVNSEKELGDFTLWDTTVIYDLNDIVEGSNGRFYQSLSNSNQANDPTLIETSWKEIRFIGVWNTNVTYALGDIVQTAGGNLWKALAVTASNDPDTDNGTNWGAAVKITESVIPQMVSGTLTAGGLTNEIRDSGAFTMPLASSVLADVVLVVNLPDTFSEQAPTLTRSGSDVFRNIQGTDTVISWIGAAKLTLTSNGVNEWSL